MTDTSFVRHDMLSEQDPPASEVGIFGWMRENLFSSWFNGALTAVAIVALYFIVTSLFGWAWQPTWVASSLNECRNIWAADVVHSTGHDPACWGVIRDRWVQLLFGFYPADLYWRPILAFALLFVALAPVLFSEYVPRALIYVTMAYPFAMIWLLWGGAFWSPLLVVAGFFIGWLAYRLVEPFGGQLGATIASVFVAVIWWTNLMPVVSDQIDRGVGGARMEMITAQTEARVAELEPMVADLKATIDEQSDTVDARMEEGLAAHAENQPALLDFLWEIKPDRDSLNDNRRLMSAYETELSDANTLLRKIDNLTEQEASLPVLRDQAEAARAALPDTVSGITNERNLNKLVEAVDAGESDVPSDDLDALAATLELESDVTGLEISIEGTYKEVALIGLRLVDSRSFGGMMLSITIGVVAIGFSLPIGIVLALGRQSDLLIVKGICIGFIEFIRGVPLITLLFVASVLLNIFLPPGTNFDIILRVIIMATLFASAYMAEVIRGGLAALPKGQYEGADSLGLNYWQAQQLIIMPQALKISIPGIVSTFIGLFKDTTLVSIIALFDPLGLSNAIRANAEWNGILWELYGFIALMFFVFCFGMSRYSMYLERKLQTDHR